MSVNLHCTRYAAFAALLTLSACHVVAVDAPKRITAQTSVTPVDTKATPSAAAPAKTTTAARIATGALQRPTSDVRAIAGTVLLEANYGLKFGGGTLVANNGGSVLRLGDSGLIANNSGNLIANNSAGIVSDNGGGLISDNGGGIVSDNGGGVIANNGGGLTSKTKFGLLQSQSTDVAAGVGTTFGTVLPTAGLQLGIVDLTTGKLLPLGQDAAGVPAYIIVTNAAGGFQAFLPTAATGSIRLIAIPRDGTDVRLGTALVTSRQDAAVQLDEDSAQVANDVRLVLAAGLLKAVTAGPDEAALDDGILQLLDPIVAADIKLGFAKVLDAFKKYGVAAMPLARQRAIAARLSDIQMGHIKLEEITAAPTLPFLKSAGSTTEPPPLALVTVGKIMRALREQVSRVMQAQAAVGVDPETYFAGKPFIIDANARDNVKYAIRKPADFDDFLVRAFFATTSLSVVDSSLHMAQVFTDPDLRGSADPRLFAQCQIGLSLAVLRQSYTLDSPILRDMLTALDQLAAPPKKL